MELSHFRPISQVQGMYLGQFLPILGFQAWVWASFDLFWGFLAWIWAILGLQVGSGHEFGPGRTYFGGSRHGFGLF